MPKIKSNVVLFLFCCFFCVFCSYAHSATKKHASRTPTETNDFELNYNYAARLPQQIDYIGEKIIIVNPNIHVWGAYDQDGNLMRAGLMSAGADWCFDTGRRCHTKAGLFRVFSLGSPYCKSSLFPIPNGGAPMPYCMFFNKNQALHGVHKGEVVEGNVSHGCVRLTIEDAKWLRYNFVELGTLVIVYSY